MLVADVEKNVGGTPLVPLNGVLHSAGVQGELLGKYEAANPGGSIKDRAAMFMLDAAEAQGKLGKGGVIVEPTSGNTGVGLAWLSALRGYTLILTMPESMSVERRRLCAAYGARIELTPAGDGMKGAVDRAEELCTELNGFMPMQFDNPANALAHEKTTAVELFEEAPEMEALIATVGTGGTISGCAHGLRELGSGAAIIAVEPAESPLLSGGQAGPHGIQGIGANFVPSLLDRDAIDEVITVSTEDAMACARLVAREDGLLVGISSGAAISAALAYMRSPAYEGGKVVCILPDTGERYLSTALFAEV